MKTEPKSEARKSQFREYAGVLAAFMVVIAFCVIGFIDMAAQAFLGQSITAAGDWSAAMLSLASAALGYLIGKQGFQVDPAAPPPPVILPAPFVSGREAVIPNASAPTTPPPPKSDR